MTLNVFAQAKNEVREANRPSTRVIQVDRYLPHENPGQWKIEGTDIYNLDEKGAPKKVTVMVNNPDGNVMGVSDFANRNSLTHTEVGGFIRVDRAIERGNGNIMARHLKRLSIDKSLTRIDQRMETAKIGIGKNWVKIRPFGQLQADGRPKEFANANNNGRQHRGLAYVIPEEQSEIDINVASDDINGKLKKAAEQAIDKAPDKTSPMVRLRIDGINDGPEIIMPNQIRDPQTGNYANATREQQLDAFFNNNMLQAILRNLESNQMDTVIHAGHGFTVGVFGTTVDFQTGQPLEKSAVEQMISETQRRITRPDSAGKPVEVERRQEYKLAITSIEIPFKDPKGNPSQRNNATLTSLGVQPGVVASPVGHPNHVTENPYAHEWSALRQSQAPAPAPAAAAPANDGHQASYEAQAPIHNGATNNQANDAAAQPQPSSQAPAASAEQASHDQQIDAALAAQADMALDELPDDMPDDFDLMPSPDDLDDLEQQTGMGMG
ncbi:hypothetical protein EZI54_07180 [Marinobacter halodurans]|uniref:Uncharacterized protein n=1 Tax=Marinobacter halodurans TaxID=2528979 RepID=A0ABY1ZM83_9GAMM|nr:hypothetical protein [Marinobacter halodurans]TBW57434.1 hypothetical protein EZI54_07180 [Marinobacter halodurans]